ncbi:hypothetical protein [Confluentibacter sediminis]|uniref:hypothetical protein n=1 Tax=Confluentibacter sediminis TaxID=2219045 RepID=UPI000DAC60B9|nr:hypothetical protein [Confluentibacter sediminis]
MKRILTILVLIVSLHAFSQSLECCHNVEEVKKAIEGDWKLKGDTRNVVYRIWFVKDKGFIEALEELNLPPKAEATYSGKSAIEEQTLVDVTFENGLFFMDIMYGYGEVLEPISVLNNDNFIFGKGVSQHVFIKDKG